MLLRAGLLYSELYISVYIKCVCWRQRGQSSQADSSARFLRATHILRALLDMKSITIVSCWNKSIHSVPSVLYSVSQLYRIMYISNTQNTKSLKCVESQLRLQASAVPVSLFTRCQFVEKRAVLEEWRYWRVFSWGIPAQSSLIYCCLWPIFSAYNIYWIQSRLL